ncbi:hypothetical protein DER29_4336 [Micromonospora sp. M71_S20]|nr:hypothetical protein DER29_4336 [Micromonospora sp. M71_S20]
MTQPEQDQGDDREAAADRITMDYRVELELPEPDADAQED